VLADQSAVAKAVQTHANGEADGMVIDKTPIADDAESRSAADDGFGGFDDEEDEQYIVRAKRNAMRKKGVDPKASAKVNGKTKAKSH
jgi:ribosomal RNA methyltransferase Nop2